MSRSGGSVASSSCESVMSTTTVSSKSVGASSRGSKGTATSSTVSSSVTASSTHSKSTSVIRDQLSTLEAKLDTERKSREEAQRDLQRTIDELKAMEKLLGVGAQ